MTKLCTLRFPRSYVSRTISVASSSHWCEPSWRWVWSWLLDEGDDGVGKGQRNEMRCDSRGVLPLSRLGWRNSADNIKSHSQLIFSPSSLRPYQTALRSPQGWYRCSNHPTTTLAWAFDPADEQTNRSCCWSKRGQHHRGGCQQRRRNEVIELILKSISSQSLARAPGGKLICYSVLWERNPRIRSWIAGQVK